MRGQEIPADSRFYEPVLRRDFVKKARPFLRAGMDISDGLYCDVNKLLDANGLGLEPLQEIPAEIGESGEEYEMLIAFEASSLDRLLRIAQEEGISLTIFGRVASNRFRYPCGSQHFRPGT